MVQYGKLKNNIFMRGYVQENPYQRERKLLGDKIKLLRERNKMTQEDLAHVSHINVSYLAKIENGYVNTTIRYLIKISRGLKVQVKDLFEF